MSSAPAYEAPTSSATDPRRSPHVDGVGTDFALKQGMCGKGGQWVPVAFGTPTLRIATLTVGGLA